MSPDKIAAIDFVEDVRRRADESLRHRDVGPETAGENQLQAAAQAAESTVEPPREAPMEPRFQQRGMPENPPARTVAQMDPARKAKAERTLEDALAQLKRSEIP